MHNGRIDMQKKLLYLTSRVFWPTKSGHEVHIYNYCRALKEKYGYCVDVYIFDDQKTVNDALKYKPSFLNSIICGEKISKFDIVGNGLSKIFFNENHWTIQSSLYFNKANCQKLQNLEAKNHYDVLFVDMIRLAPYINAFSNSSLLTVLDMGDMLSKRYRRQISIVNENSNVGGVYTDSMSKIVKSILRQKWLQKAILKIENKLMSKSEIYWAERYDSTILVSTVETDELNMKLSKPKAVTVRVGVDSDFFGEENVSEKGNGLVSFVGDMRTAANSDTVRYLINNILPLCKKINKMTFIGKCPDGLREEYKGKDNIQFVGMVPDLRAEVKKTNVFLAPMSYGTGVKIKIVEAMAMGMPVVTNPIGAEGIPGENGVHWYVGNSDSAIAEYVDKLLVDPVACADMGKNAQRLIDKTFSWNAATKSFALAGL